MSERRWYRLVKLVELYLNMTFKRPWRSGSYKTFDFCWIFGSLRRNDLMDLARFVDVSIPPLPEGVTKINPDPVIYRGRSGSLPCIESKLPDCLHAGIATIFLSQYSDPSGEDLASIPIRTLHSARL